MSDVEIEIKYPLRDESKQSKWTDEFRREWNRKYRREIKEGLRQPHKSDKPSKWDNPAFRKAYEEARRKKLDEEKLEKKMSFDQVDEKRPNYTSEEKKLILNKMFDMIREGKEPVHPYFELSLNVKPKFKRKYPSKKKDTQEDST